MDLAAKFTLTELVAEMLQNLSMLVFITLMPVEMGLMPVHR